MKKDYMEKNIKEFVETWIIAVKNGHTTTDIKEALSFKMTESKISNRASYLRKLRFNPIEIAKIEF